MIWSLIFFEMARRFAKREMKMVSRRDEDVLNNNALLSTSAMVNVVYDDEQESNRMEQTSTLQYYHSKFRPPHGILS